MHRSSPVPRARPAPDGDGTRDASAGAVPAALAASPRTQSPRTPARRSGAPSGASIAGRSVGARLLVCRSDGGAGDVPGGGTAGRLRADRSARRLRPGRSAMSDEPIDAYKTLQVDP